MKRVLLCFVVFVFSAYAGFPQSIHISPPSDMDIIKWFVNGFPKRHNGWELEYRQALFMYGYTSGSSHYILHATCDNCGYLPKYTYDIYYDYGNEDASTLKVILNRDTVNKYFNLQYKKR